MQPADDVPGLLVEIRDLLREHNAAWAAAIARAERREAEAFEQQTRAAVKQAESMQLARAGMRVYLLVVGIALTMLAALLIILLTH